MITMKYVMFALMLVFAGCIVQAPPANETVLTDVSPPSNITENMSGITVPDPDYAVQFGDTVWVDYVLRVDGEIYDTSKRDLVFGTNEYNPARNYAPLQFVVEFNSGIIDGVIINTIGMKVNETVRYDVEPSRGYGLSDPSKIILIPRYYDKSFYETIPRDYLESQGVEISNGTGFERPYGPVFIHDFNEENVTLFYVFIKGAEFELNGVPQRIANITNTSATIEFALDVNESYWLPVPETQEWQIFRILEKDDEYITLDYNHPLANKTLNFEVTLVKVEPAK